MKLYMLLSHFSRVQLCANPWTAAHQAPLSMEFSRKEYWSGLPLPSPYIYINIYQFSSVKFSRSVVSDSLRPHELQHDRPPCPSPSPGVHSNSSPSSPWCFGSIPPFFLELSVHWSPVAYWAATDLGSSSFSILSFCLFILFMGFSRQEYWSGLPFPSPVDHILSDLSSMICLSWVAPQGMA